MIDQELVKYLSDEHKTRMMALESTFNSDGWKLFKDYLTEKYQVVQHAVLNSTSWEDNRLQTGQMQVLQAMLNIEEATANEFENAAREVIITEEDEEIDRELEYE